MEQVIEDLKDEIWTYLRTGTTIDEYTLISNYGRLKTQTRYVYRKSESHKAPSFQEVKGQLIKVKPDRPLSTYIRYTNENQERKRLYIRPYDLVYTHFPEGVIKVNRDGTRK